MKDWYKTDLAFIHDVGFREWALASAPGILRLLSRNKIHDGLVVDLGCGSGLWAAELISAGYNVLGIDISDAMIRLARQRAPQAVFRVASLFEVDLPRCQAITAISECINYLFDERNSGKPLTRFFRRVYDALVPGGVFIFDVAEPGQVPRGQTVKGFTEGDGWTVLVEKQEDDKQRLLTRRIITFRKAGKSYRRDEESHRQRLYDADEITGQLHHVGFGVQRLRGYGDFRLPHARTAFLARKPIQKRADDKR